MKNPLQKEEGSENRYLRARWGIKRPLLSSSQSEASSHSMTRHKRRLDGKELVLEGRRGKRGSRKKGQTNKKTRRPHWREMRLLKFRVWSPSKRWRRTNLLFSNLPLKITKMTFWGHFVYTSFVLWKIKFGRS